MENLPSDVLENILFRLPVDADIQAKRVCTTWRAILRTKTGKQPGFVLAYCDHEPGFAFPHHGKRVTGKLCFYEDRYDHYALSKTMKYYYYDRFKESVLDNVMVGSCNGLVCFGKHHVKPFEVQFPACKPFLVCNPFTRKSAALPEFNLHPEISGTKLRLASGFGYCPSTNDYKVVTILYCNEEQKEAHVQVYTLGRGEWRYIGRTRHHRCAFNYASGIYARGALFWLHQRSNHRVRESEIAAFDLESEKFHYIALPPSEDFEYVAYNFPLKLLGGNDNLYLVHTITGASRADIWVYQGRIPAHWHKEFSVQLDFPACFKPLAITRSNAVLWYDWIDKGTYLYDPRTSTLHNLWVDKANGSVYNEAVPHTHSIVSLKDLGETNVTAWKDLEKRDLRRMLLAKHAAMERREANKARLLPSLQR